MVFDERNLQLSHKSRRSHPKVVTNHQDRLHVIAITLAERMNQFCFGNVLPTVQPLFELIDNDYGLLTGPVGSLAQLCDGIDKANVVRQTGMLMSQTPQQTRFRLRCGCLDKDRRDVFVEQWKQSGSHERRLSATRRSVDQSHRERQFDVARLDAILPKSQTIRDAKSIAWSRQQL